MRYGLRIEDVQRVIELALGGMPVSQSVEGRERTAFACAIPRMEKFGGRYRRHLCGHQCKPARSFGQLADIRFEKALKL